VPPLETPEWRRFYLPVKAKFVIALVAACGWAGLSIWLSVPWLRDLAGTIGWAATVFIITFIAYVPGFMNAFLVSTILLDRRPARTLPSSYPGVTVLVACYNEAGTIADTLRSLSLQDYAGPLEVLVLDDGSTDATAAIAEQAAAAFAADDISIRVVRSPLNRGKAVALNRGLAMASHEHIATIDGDSWLHPGAMQKIVERRISDPPGTKAVAGAVLVRNSRENWLTRSQEWDYFHGMAAVKRMQSMYHGTLVAQGAF
jgi:biofilm PGA synthesis N-glycosyltransferase PgaC